MLAIDDTHVSLYIIKTVVGSTKDEIGPFMTELSIKLGEEDVSILKEKA